jgi:hypothetical protein
VSLHPSCFPLVLVLVLVLLMSSVFFSGYMKGVPTTMIDVHVYMRMKDTWTVMMIMALMTELNPK